MSDNSLLYQVITHNKDHKKAKKQGFIAHK